MSALEAYTAQWAERREDNPENWPTVSEWPQPNVDDLVRAAQYQSTIDMEYEAE